MVSCFDTSRTSQPDIQPTALAHHPPLQDILRTIRLDCTNQTDEKIVMYAFRFLEYRISTDVENTIDHLIALGLEPLDFQNDGSSINDSFIRAFFFTYMGPQYPWRDVFLSASENRALELHGVLVRDLVELEKRWRFIETATGHFGFDHYGPSQETESSCSKIRPCQ
jgi:hypothetical protein